MSLNEFDTETNPRYVGKVTLVVIGSESARRADTTVVQKFYPRRLWRALRRVEDAFRSYSRYYQIKVHYENTVNSVRSRSVAKAVISQVAESLTKPSSMGTILASIKAWENGILDDEPEEEVYREALQALQCPYLSDPERHVGFLTVNVTAVGSVQAGAVEIDSTMHHSFNTIVSGIFYQRGEYAFDRMSIDARNILNDTTSMSLRRALREKTLSLRHSLGPVDGLDARLCEYQKRSLQFCLNIENGKEKFWIEIKDGLWYSPFLFRFSTSGEEPRGGILADEMGLGKTVVMLGLILSNPPNPQRITTIPAGNTLIVCPTTLVGQWVAEIKNRISDSKVYIYHGQNRVRSASFLARKQIVVTTYGILSADRRRKWNAVAHEYQMPPPALEMVNWHRIIYDESHILANTSTTQYRVATSLVGDHRWCVTGTPAFGKYYAPFKAQIGLILPTLGAGVIPPETEYCNPAASIVMKLMVRHRKTMRINDRSILELPPCMIENNIIDLDETTREEYETREQSTRTRLRHALGIEAYRILNRLRKYLSSGDRVDISNSIAFKILQNETLRTAAVRRIEEQDQCSICLCSFERPVVTECQHVFCGACMEEFFKGTRGDACPLCRSPVTKHTVYTMLQDDEDSEGSDCIDSTPTCKIDKLKQILREADPDDKFILFTQFTETIHAVQESLKDMHMTCESIVGSSTRSKRTKILESFQRREGGNRVLIMSVRSGAVGVNLTRANRIVFMEPFMNPDAEQQAIGRAYRMGQERPVFVHRLVTKGTIEERIINRFATRTDRMVDNAHVRFRDDSAPTSLWNTVAIRELLEQG